jgi:hypothetical protein
MFPEDLIATKPWVLSFSVCVSKQGRVETVAPIDNVVHPRVFGPVLDSFLRAQYVPPKVQGEPIAFCHPVRFEITKYGF